MDNSGSIREFDTEEEARKHGFLHPLKREQAKELSLIPRRERRAHAIRKGWINPIGNNNRQRNAAEAKRRKKRMKKATLEMQKRARHAH